MKKFCKILDDKTGLVQLGAGCSDEYYISIGMTLKDVEQSEIDFQWYLTNKCPHYTEQEKFEMAKADKYAEALGGAKQFIETEACYQFNKSNSIEATDGNIGKFTAYALGFVSGAYESVQWTSKEDNVLTLNQEQVQTILFGLGAIQSNVWNVQFVAYKNLIEQAETIEDINAIEVHYD